MTACPKCGTEVPRSTTAGRPRTYCTTGCRRATEYELRRLQKALEEVEEQIRFCRLGWNGRRPAHVGALDTERRGLETRLQSLLNTEGEQADGKGFPGSRARTEAEAVSSEVAPDS